MSSESPATRRPFLSPSGVPPLGAATALSLNPGSRSGFRFRRCARSNSILLIVLISAGLSMANPELLILSSLPAAPAPGLPRGPSRSSLSSLLSVPRDISDESAGDGPDARE